MMGREIAASSSIQNDRGGQSSKNSWCRGTCTSRLRCWGHCSTSVLMWWGWLFLSWVHQGSWLSCLPPWSECDADPFLWTEIDDNSSVHDGSICWDEPDLIVRHHKNCICAFLPHFIVTLRHASKIFSKCCLPYFPRGRVVHQFFVTRYCFARCRMNHGHCQVF